MKFTPTSAALISAGLLLSLSGCSTFKDLFDSTPVNYQHTDQISALAVPPDLTTPTSDKRYEVPTTGSASNDTTWSAYHASQQASTSQTATPPTANLSPDTNSDATPSTDVLPTPPDGVMLERDGSQRWLVVDQPAEKIWPILVAFWQDNGFSLIQNDAKIGALLTDWKLDSGTLPQDSTHNTLGKVPPGLYSSNQRDQFHTHIERDPAQPNRTDIYLTERVISEVYDNSVGSSHTQWQTSAADLATEAEMLTRIMQRFGVSQPQAQSILAAPHQNSGFAHVGKTSSGVVTLTDAEPFDRTWLRVGMALNQLGYHVVGTDKAKGIYTITEAQTAVNDKASTGIWDTLAFWKQMGNNVTRYQVELDENPAATSTDIRVLTDTGATAPTDLGNRVIQKLYTQLK